MHGNNDNGNNGKDGCEKKPALQHVCVRTKTTTTTGGIHLQRDLLFLNLSSFGWAFFIICYNFIIAIIFTFVILTLARIEMN